MTAYLCPVYQEPQFSDNDEFLAGGLLWFYEAGSSTLATAYTTEAGDVAWSNPIVLDARGESGGTIWLKAGQAYRIVLEGKPAYGQTHGTEITEHDGITGINDPSVGATDGNWILFSGEPTYLSATSFSVSGDYRDIFTQYRRLYTNNSGGVVYGSVSSSSYASGITTVVITNDSGTLDVGLNAVYYAFIDPISLPTTYDNLNLVEVNNSEPWTDANNTYGIAAPGGFIEFANGVSFWRGQFTISVPSGTINTYTSTEYFSSPFPTGCLEVVACWGDYTQVADEVLHVNSFDAEKVTFQVYFTGVTTVDHDFKVRVIAIGY